MLKSGQACASPGFRTLRKHDLPRSHGASRERAERAQRERDTGETRARPGCRRWSRRALAIRQTRGERAGRISAATHRAGPCDYKINVSLSTACMTAAASAQTQPPEAELQFDIGSTDDSLER